MKNNFILAIDGSAGSERAIEFAAERAKLGGATVIIVYVIEWSPYSFNTPTENAERHKRREAELERATSTIVQPVAEKLKQAGLKVETVVRHGHPSQTLADLATSKDAAQIFIGRRGESALKSMLFGSVTANLVQTSPVPVTVVP